MQWPGNWFITKNNKTSITLIFSKGKSNVQQQKLDVQYVPNQLHDYVVLQIISLTIKTPMPLIDVAFFVADVFNWLSLKPIWYFHCFLLQLMTWNIWYIINLVPSNRKYGSFAYKLETNHFGIIIMNFSVLEYSNVTFIS